MASHFCIVLFAKEPGQTNLIMRKLVILIICAFCAYQLSYSQVKHFSFLDVEMGGELASFYQKISDKGFATIQRPAVIWRDSYYAVLKGEFAGQKNAEITIYADRRIVNMVTVQFEDAIAWGMASPLYKSLVSSYTNKYKTSPSESKGNPDIDGSECSSRYEVIDGVIVVSLKKGDTGRFHVELTYRDSPGNGRKAEERSSTIMTDI